MRTSRILFWSAGAAAVAAMGLAQAPKAAAKLTIDDLVRIKHPSGAQWTPDGRHVWFTYDDGGVNNLWDAPADGSSPAVPLTAYANGQTAAGGFWSRDGQTFYFPREGGLLAVSVHGGTPATAWPSAAKAADFVLSPDGARVAFVSAGTDLIIHDLAGNRDQTVARAEGQGRIGGASWSPDGAKLAYTVSGDGGSDLMVDTLAAGAPVSIVHAAGNLNGASWTPDGGFLMYTSAPAGAGGGAAGGGRAAGGRGAGAGRGAGQILTERPEIGAKLLFVTNTGGGGGRGAGGGGASFIVPASGGTPRALNGARGGGGRGGSNWLDATHVLSSATSNGGKTRTALSVDINAAPGAEPVTLHSETEDKFFSAVNTTVSAISPDRHWLLYTSDATGWDQIYVVPTAGGTPVQISREPGDHWRAVWSHDSRRIAWDTDTPEHPGDREIEFATLGDNPAQASIVAVTRGKGTNTSPQWSPDDARLLYQHTDAENSADLYVAAAAANAAPVRLTSSMPAGIDHSMFVAPELIHYPGPDGKPVPAWLFVPHNLDRTRLHAAIVWIHPDGVNQNYDGWHTDRNEAVYYEFHQYLLQEGYVVIAPDYRGSIGYGRDWRNDVYMDVGGNDAKDARMAAGYLKTLGYVDASRIGVWGLSYGGFFTLQAITQEPTWFRAAVDVAGVVDYALYYEDPYHGGWTTSRIGTPEENPAVYAKAAPMSHVDQIQHPLLILAGTADTNVPFIESALLVDSLLKAGKGDLVTFMMYPGEFHYFDRSFVVRDAWHRVDAFFGENLKPQLTPKR